MAEIRRYLTAALLTLAAGSAAAQTSSTENVWARGTELGVSAAGATTTSQNGPMFAGTAGWEVTQRVTIEGRGSWFFPDPGAGAFSADVSGLVNLVPKRDVTPFVGLGFGLYRATFDTPGDVSSDFYRNRLPGATNVGQSISFTDPSFRVSGGVDFIVKRYLTIRPEVSAFIVRRGGSGDETYSFGVRVGYRFEDHPITK